MDAATLQKCAPGLSAARAEQFIEGLNEALVLAECTTVDRVAMFMAQVLEESIGLQFTEEIADGTDYDRFLNPTGPWQQLGNTEAGDGVRFKGRSFIQITGRSHYGAFSKWAHKRDLVSNTTFFVDNPTHLANDEFACVGAAWYWMNPHPHDGMQTLNEAADAKSVLTATHMVNGGEHGLKVRQANYDRCLTLGDALLPTQELTMTPEDEAKIQKMIDARADATDERLKRILAELRSLAAGHDGKQHRIETLAVMAQGKTLAQARAQLAGMPDAVQPGP
jgi:predicted chitinase